MTQDADKRCWDCKYFVPGDEETTDFCQMCRCIVDGNQVMCEEGEEYAD